MKLLKLLLILSLYSQVLSAQENQIKENTNVWNDLRHSWKSWWISHPSASLLDYGVFHYRKTFELKEVPKTFMYMYRQITVTVCMLTERSYVKDR